MKLVEQLPWQENVIDAPPMRLVEAIHGVPSEFDLTLIGTRHDVDGGEPDYITSIVDEADVVFLEQPQWTNKRAKRMQAVANGEYTALRETRLRLGIEDGTATGSEKWLWQVYQQLFESKVRLVPTDYPKGHPQEAKLHRLMTRVSHYTEAHFPHFLLRDQFIAGHTIDTVRVLRKNIPEIADKQPLRVTMLIGAGHYAISEALARVAAAEEVGSFTTRTLFEESAGMETSGSHNDERLANHRQELTAYQNWLRTQ